MDQLLATTLFGLEKVLASELQVLGAREIEVRNRLVGFRGNKAMMYRANYHLRTALRVLRAIRSFPADKEDDIYNGTRRIEWERYLGPWNTVAVDTVLVSRKFRHSVYLSQRVKDGIVDRLRDRTGKRPSVDLKDPDVRIHVHVDERLCNISMNSSGESLHKRGYRTQPYIAPLNEVLAAGMILLSGWDPATPFLNPMCGSGTLAIEAGMIARGLPGGYHRDQFGFQRWRDFEAPLFESVRRERFFPIHEGTPIMACDIAYPAIRASQQNFASAGMLDSIAVKRQSFAAWDPGRLEPGVLIMNPPYGERMQTDDLVSMYAEIGNVLKRKYSGWKAWLLSANPEALKHVGLRTSKRLSLMNGKLKCKYQAYDLYAGSLKNNPSSGRLP